jgi:hypothetical protein
MAKKLTKFKKEEPVQIWDYLGVDENGEDKKEGVLPGHRSIGLIIRKSASSDVVAGYPLGQRAKDCYLVAVPNQEEAVYHYHCEWLRKV